MQLSIRPLLAAALIALSACTTTSRPEDEPTPTPFPTPVKPTFIVQRGDLVRGAEFFGRITPVVSREVFFARNGRVGQVYAEVGDQVEAGQLLADLDVLDVLQKEWVAAAEAVQLHEEAARKVVRRAEIDLEIARLTLDLYIAEGRSPFEIQIQTLEVERAQMALDEVSINPDLQAAKEKVKQIEAEMAEAQLVSPVAGTVIAAVEAGQAVRTTTSAFVIGDATQLEISASPETALLKELIENMAVTVALTDEPEITFAGTIRRLPYPYGSGSSESNDDSVRITPDVSSAEGGYKLGDQVQVSVVLGQKAGALWLPPEAIRSAGGRVFVFVQTESGPKQVNITTGLQTPDQVEIVDGLSEGDVVIAP